MNKRWSSGKIAAVVCGGIAAVVALWVSLMVSVLQLSEFLSREPAFAEASAWEENQEAEPSPDRFKEPEEEQEKEKPEGNVKDNEETEYYEFENDLQGGLAYEVDFRQYDKDDFQGKEGKGEVRVRFSYPVILGDVINLEGINDAIQKELKVVTEHAASVVDYLDEDELYEFTGEAYVTYMSQRLLSVAYVEYGYLDGEYLESYVVCVNVDMETGMVLDNTQLLQFDDSFSIDFRERCQRQNGEIDALSYLSDQEITSYLKDTDSLIALYTPLGMEIGFNYYDGWVTVTYRDYEQYRKQF